MCTSLNGSMRYIFKTIFYLVATEIKTFMSPPAFSATVGEGRGGVTPSTLYNDKRLDFKITDEIFGIEFQRVGAYIKETVPRVKAALTKQGK
jgi:hypothetical protein